MVTKVLKKAMVFNLILLSCLAVPSAIQSPDLKNVEALQKKVTFSSVAAVAPRLVEKLSEEVKVRLMTSTQLVKDVLFVHAEDVALHDLMARIATATSADWKAESGGYRLIRSAQTERQQAKAELDEKERLLRAELTKQINQLDTQPSNIAYNRLALKAARSVDLRALAAMRQNERIVFATDPNSRQRPINLTYDQIFGMAVEELNRNRATKPVTLEVLQKAFERASEAGSDFPAVPPRRPKVLLVADTQWSTLPKLSLRFYDKNGHVVIGGTATLEGGRPATQPESADSRMLALVEGSDQKLELEGSSKEIHQVFSADPNSGRRQWLSPALDAKFLRTDQNDPFSWQVSDFLIQTAKHKKLNLVANLPDQVPPVFYVWGNMSMPRSVNEFLRKLSAHVVPAGSDEGSWLTLVPRQLHEARESRTDRVSLAQLLAASSKTRVAGLDALSSFLLAHPNRTGSEADMAYLLMYCPNALGMGDTAGDYNLMRFYGTLTVEQKREFRRGSEISFRSIPPQSRPYLEKLLFAADTYPLIGRIQPTFEPDPTPTPNPSIPPPPLPTWREETTEVLPNGIPADGWMKAKVTETPVGIFVGDSMGHSASGSQGAFRLGSIRQTLESTGPDWQERYRVRLGRRWSAEISMVLAQDVTVLRLLTDDMYTEGTPVLSWKELPSDLIAEMNLALEKNRKRREEIERSQQARRPPPPQPGDLIGLLQRLAEIR